MVIFQQRVASFLAAMTFAAVSVGTASAAGVVLNNEMERDIKALYCVDRAGAAKQVSGALQAKSTTTVTPDKFPEHECERLAVFMADGEAWQFYHEPEPGAASEILFSMDKAQRHEERSYPSLLISSSGESYVSAAGVPFSYLTQAMQFGLNEAQWKEMAVPQKEGAAKSGSFAVSLGDVSWSFADGSPVFAELVPGMQLVQSVSMSAPFANSTLMSLFEQLKASGATPWALSFKGKDTVLTKEGKEFLPTAQLEGSAQSDESNWEAVYKMLETVADSDGEGTPRLVFGSESLIFDLTLNLGDSTATLTVIRKAEAAFG